MRYNFKQFIWWGTFLFFSKYALIQLPFYDHIMPPQFYLLIVVVVLVYRNKVAITKQKSVLNFVSQTEGLIFYGCTLYIVLKSDQWLDRFEIYLVDDKLNLPSYVVS